MDFYWFIKSSELINQEWATIFPDLIVLFGKYQQDQLICQADTNMVKVSWTFTAFAQLKDSKKHIPADEAD